MKQSIQHKAFTTSFDETTEGLVKAFVSVYGNVDSAQEICDYGCFKDSLDYKAPVFCLYHNWELPIGKVVLAEEIPAGDTRLPKDLQQWGGLYVEAQINLDKEIGRDAWSDIKHGVLDEYSIGYVVQEDFIDKKGYRHLTKVDLIECSPVVRAANRMTKTVEVKSEERLLKQEENSQKKQINTKQMNEILDQIQEHLAAVMAPIDELKAMLASAQILEDEGIAEPLAQMEEPLQASLGFLDELRINLAEMGYLDAVEPVATEPAPTEPAQADNTEETEIKALDLEAALELLQEIMTISEEIVSISEIENAGFKSIDNIMTEVATLMSVVQEEIDAPTGEVDLQAMVDAFAVINTNVDELMVEAEGIDPEAVPEVADYIAKLEAIKAVATQLTEIVMAEMENSSAPEEADGTKAVASVISLEEQLELEQLFSRVLQSQFNINN